MRSTSNFNFLNTSKPEIDGVNRRVLVFGSDKAYEKALKLLIESSSRYFIRNIDPEFDLIDNIQMCDPGLLLYEFDGDIQHLSAIRRGISQLKRRPKILVVVKEEHLIYTDKLLEIGVDGAIIKGLEVGKIVDVLSSLENNNYYLAQKIVNYLVIKMTKNGKADLTDREHEVLILLGQGLSYKAIADKLHIGLETVRSHVKNLYAKLNVSSKAEALEFSRKNKMI